MAKGSEADLPAHGGSGAMAAVAPEDRDLPLLVAVHGWLLSGRLWEPLDRQLQGRLEVWRPDLPGFGAAERPRGLQPSLASYGRWLADAVRRRAGTRPVLLVGHSLGGSIVLHAAPGLAGQLRGVVLVAAGGGVFQPRAFARVRQGGAAFLALRPSWMASLPALTPWNAPLRAEGRAARGLLACSTNRGAVAGLPRLVARLAVPSLWIAGSRDSVMAPRYVRHLAGYCPSHRFSLLEGAGHLPMQTMPEQLAALIEDWAQEEGLLAPAREPQSASGQPSPPGLWEQAETARGSGSSSAGLGNRAS